MSDEMDEIWALYLDDGTQSLDAMEAALLAVQDDPDGDNSEHVSALFRAVHTFKGNSRVLGLGVVESRAHVAEDLIGLVRDEGAPLDEEIIDILLYAGDILRGMLEETSNAREDVDPTGSEELMEQLRDKLARAKAVLNGGDIEEVPAQTGQEPAVEAISDALAMLDEAQAETDQEDAGDDVADSEPEQGVGEADPEPEPVEDTAPEVEPDPDPESEPESEPVAEAAEPVSEEAEPVAVGTETPKRLIDDPSYRDIFFGMANDALAKLQAVLDDFASDAEASSAKARKEVDNLHHAAGQMGLPDWVEFLDAFLADTADNSQTDVEGLAALILKLQEAKQVDLCDAPDTSAPAPEGNFLGAISDALATLSQAGLDWTAGKVPSDGFIEEKASIVRDAAEAENLSRIAEIAGKLITATDAKSYREAELRLYEELTAVESVLVSDGDQTVVRPRELLRQWCSSHVFDTIAAIEWTLEQFRSGKVADEVFNEFSRQMRLVFHACSHNKLDTAGQLAMSLIDLFSRVQTSVKTPDTILTRIARGFIDTIEIVFNAVAQGEIPDTQNLDDLFEQASNACFLSEGLMTATAIERALNLPVEFHRVLSPDSVRAASKAIEKHENFFIVRADINDQEELAEKFLELISSDAVDAITNVTVFRGTDTLFDFLLATPLSQSSFVSQVAEIDPSGKDIKVTEMLHYEATGDATEAGNGGDIDQGINQGQGLTAEMLEDISEVAASQAMVNHMLADLSEVDLTEGVEALIRSAKGDTSAAFDGIKKLVSDHAARLQEICQVEGQLVAQMSHLQEQTVAIRSKPVEILIRPLEALVQTISRKGRSAAKLTSAGGDLSIDVMLMENLRKILRSLISTRLADQDDAPDSLHLSFHRDDERVLVTLEDNGSPSNVQFADDDEIRPLLASSGSELLQVTVPGGGMRYRISMPLAMVVLEGMVVGVEGVRYVIPVDAIRSIVQPQADALRVISAGDGEMMLRVDDGPLIGVHNLSQSRGLQTLDAEGIAQRRVYVILNAGNRNLAIPVDELLGQQLVLLRPLRGVLRNLKNLTGIALLAGGEVGMVLSTNALSSEQEVAA